MVHTSLHIVWNKGKTSFTKLSMFLEKQLFKSMPILLERLAMLGQVWYSKGDSKITNKKHRWKIFDKKTFWPSWWVALTAGFSLTNFQQYWLTTWGAVNYDTLWGRVEEMVIRLFSMIKCESPDYSIIAQCFSIGVSCYVLTMLIPS